MTQNEGKTFYTRDEVAERLGVSTRTVDRLRAEGKLKDARSARGRGRGGTRIYFDAANVEELARELFAPKV